MNGNVAFAAPNGDVESRFVSNINDLQDDVIGGDGSSSPDNQSDDATLRTLVDGNGEILLAREMAGLSTSELETVQYDIHGVTEKVTETSELLREKLSELHTTIAEIRNSDPTSASAYIVAETMNPGYVKDDSFRLLFLRASHFDVDQSCKRLLGHFEKKLELFGPQKLCKTITLDDLDADDMDCMNRGQSQLLPYRDRSGRAVFIQALSHYAYKQVVNAMRVVYYILMAALEDEETQERGVVCVVYNVEPRSPLSNDPQIYLNVYKLLPTLPVRMMGAHYCVQDSHLRMFMSNIRVAMSREVRLRSRVHHGSHQECIYALLTFGIPRRCFPISNTGELLVEKHGEFIEMRRQQERDIAANASMDPRNIGLSFVGRNIVVPKNDDVLLGRGRPFQEHAGNIRCNYIIVDTMERYEAASRNDKTTISRNVIENIKSHGGRFLKQNHRVWEEVDDSEALRKISHSFRTHRQLLKGQVNDNSSSGNSTKTTNEGSPTRNAEKRSRAS